MASLYKGKNAHDLFFQDTSKQGASFSTLDTRKIRVPVSVKQGSRRHPELHIFHGAGGGAAATQSRSILARAGAGAGVTQIPVAPDTSA